MEGTGADFTATFSSLAAAAEAPAAAPPFDAGPLADWRATWRARLDRQPQPLADAAALMRRTNPLVIPRNHRVEEALAAAVAGEMAPFEKLLDAITHPFDDTPAIQPFRDGPPPGCGPYRTFCGT
jgi:uncharacterized protein YdiU (UPF0061 family)